MTDWTPQEPYNIGDKMCMANKPTLLDRVLMALGFKRRTPEYTEWKCVDTCTSAD